MQYTEIFLALKIENFQLKKSDIFLIFAQNIDCGYKLEAILDAILNIFKPDFLNLNYTFLSSRLCPYIK